MGFPPEGTKTISIPLTLIGPRLQVVPVRRANRRARALQESAVNCKSGRLHVNEEAADGLGDRERHCPECSRASWVVLLPESAARLHTTRASVGPVLGAASRPRC